MKSERACLQAGQTVLIHAAAGGVGHIAVQLAQAREAHRLLEAGGVTGKIILTMD